MDFYVTPNTVVELRIPFRSTLFSKSRWFIGVNALKGRELLDYTHIVQYYTIKLLYKKKNQFRS